MYRSVFVLADVEGWANADIATQLGLSLPAIKSRLHRARLALRGELSALLGERADARFPELAQELSAYARRLPGDEVRAPVRSAIRRALKRPG
jgi:RNA polymerase sigma-70 factor (ECF subfamily)